MYLRVMTHNLTPRRSLLRDIAGVFSGNIAAMVAVLLTNIVLSRGLGPNGYGVYTSLLAVLMISVNLVQLGISRSAVFHLGQQAIPRQTTIHAVYNLWGLTSAAGILISIVSVLIIQNHNFTFLMICLALPVIPFILGNIYSSGIFLGIEEIRRSNMLYYIPAYLTLFISIVLVWILKLGVVGAISAALISGVITFSIASSHLINRFGISVPAPRSAILSVGKLGFVYAITHLLLQLNYKADVLLLQKMRLPAEVGFYSLGVSVTEQLWLIPYAMGLVLISRTANDTDPASSAQRTSLLLKTGFLLGAVGSVILWFVAPWVIPLIFGKQFIASVPVVQSILPGIVIFIIFRLLESHLAGMGKPWLAIWALGPSLLVNLILNLWLIPLHGALGAAWATNISYALATIVYVAIYLKTIKTTLRAMFIPTKEEITRFGDILAGKLKKHRFSSGTK